MVKVYFARPSESILRNKENKKKDTIYCITEDNLLYYRGHFGGTSPALSVCEFFMMDEQENYILPNLSFNYTYATGESFCMSKVVVTFWQHGQTCLRFAACLAAKLTLSLWITVFSDVS